MRLWLEPAAGALVLLLAGACATGPVYRPKASTDGIGYADQQLTPTRYRVSFSGSRDTPLTLVEDYLLRRAAEVTVSAGYTHFAFNTKHTEAETGYYTFGDGWNPDYALGFSLGRRFAQRQEYFSKWSYPAYVTPGQATPVARYSISSEIILLTQMQAATTPTALSAREILARLAPAQAAA